MTKCETAICQLAVNVYGKTSQCTVCINHKVIPIARIKSRG